MVTESSDGIPLKHDLIFAGLDVLFSFCLRAFFSPESLLLTPSDRSQPIPVLSTRFEVVRSRRTVRLAKTGISGGKRRVYRRLDKW